MKEKTYMQQAILDAVRKKQPNNKFQDYDDAGYYDVYSDWTEYAESYGDYNDCGGGYYDAES